MPFVDKSTIIPVVFYVPEGGLPDGVVIISHHYMLNKDSPT